MNSTSSTGAGALGAAKSSSRSLQHAFLGLGNMGTAMAHNLAQKGSLEKPLIIWNRTSSRAEECKQAAGNYIVAESVPEAIKTADIIWMCLLNSEAVMEIAGLITEHGAQGKLIVDCSTVQPDTTASVAKKYAEHGADFIAMPVFGEPTMAITSQLICVPAGPAAFIDRIEMFIVGVLGRGFIDLRDEPPEKASLLKLLGNIIIMTTMQTVAEINVVAETTGLGLEPMQKLIKTLFPRPPHTIYTDRMVSGAYITEKPMVEVHKAQKLAGEVLDLAERHGTSLASYKLAATRLAEASKLAGPTSDITGIYGAIRVASGLPFSNLKDEVNNAQ